MKKIAAALAGVLALSACSAQPEPEPQPSQSPTSMPTIAPQPKETEEAATAFVDPRVPVPCDVGRELTELEKSLLVEPGRYSAYAQNLDYASLLESIKATNPQTPNEWAIATRWAVQGDYAEDLCDLLNFEYDLGELGETPSEELQAPAISHHRHFGIALDASGSMAAESGDSTRMEQAKQAIRTFAEGLPEGSTVSLRVYGHEGSNQVSGKSVSCNSSEVIYNGSPAETGFGTALEGVQPVGWTPLGKAIEDTAADIPADANGAIIYVVSDGIETCEGDPVGAAKKVATSGVNPIINVIGFEVASSERVALEAVASSGSGSYVHATNADDLNRYWADEKRRIERDWYSWLLDERERARRIYFDKIFPMKGARISATYELSTEHIRAITSSGWPTEQLDERQQRDWERAREINEKYYRTAREYIDALFPSEAVDEYHRRYREIEDTYREAMDKNR